MTVLVPGSEYIKNFPDFTLVGRDDELRKISSVLLRNKANSIFLTGSDGVGCSDIVLGLQAAKSDPNIQLDILAKRLFWFNTNAFFAGGNSNDLNGHFSKLLGQLRRAHNAVLIVDDTRDFIDGCRNNGVMHFLNAISMDIASKDLQVVFIAKDSEINFVISNYPEINQYFTFISIDEPQNDALVSIVSNEVKSLSLHHKIKISDEVIITAIELTSKYQTMDAGLSKAQPERTLTLIDRSLSAFRLNAHKTAPVGFSESEWEIIQKQLKKHNLDLREAETAINEERDNIDSLAAKDQEKAKESGTHSVEIQEREKLVTLYQKEADKAKAKFDELTKVINNHLLLTKDHIMVEFSKISGISVNKLNQNELEKLKSLESNVKKYIFGQDLAVAKVANGIKVAKAGRRKKNKPLGSYLFLGPSGTGKTELTKKLALQLLDDEKSLTRFDMSEYMEKHAVAKLIGAPPGYEGFEAGGLLTNLVRRNGNRVLLFDEIEKAHPDVFNIFLQILDDSRLSDNLGRVANFDECLIIMTTNLGQEPFLDETLSYDEAMTNAMADLSATYKPEFLNRFAGRQNIIGFNRLDLPTIEKIVAREFKEMDKTYSEKNIRVQISDEELHKFCSTVYNPRMGGRGLPGLIETTIDPIITDMILDNPDRSGIMNVFYDVNERKLNCKFEAN